MKDIEARAKSEEKIQQLKDLAKKLQVRIVAKTAITKGNIIEPLVFYIDMEDYPIDAPEAVAPGPKMSPDKTPVSVSKLEGGPKKDETIITDLPE